MTIALLPPPVPGPWYSVRTKVAMEAELVAATRQLGLLKEGYTKARDNLRAEQSVRIRPCRLKREKICD